jgi:chitodextrinase
MTYRSSTKIFQIKDRVIVTLLFAVGALLMPLSVHAASLSVSPTTALPNTNTAVTVSWSGVTSPTSGDWIALFAVGATNYSYLTYKYTSSCSGAQSSGSCSFTVNQPAGSYEFRFLPNDGYTSTATSQTVTVSAGDTTAPTVPTGLSGTVISSSQINLTWTASTDAVGVVGYKVYRNGTQIATVTSGTSYNNTGLSPSTTYSYTVSAYDAAGNNSAQSSSVSRTTSAAPDTTAPTVPTNLVASVISSSQINLSWTASTDAVGVTGYKVYRGGTQIATVTGGTSYNNTGLSPSTTYTYTVSAYDAAANNSAQTSGVPATTLSSGSAAWVGPTQTAPSGNKTLPLNSGGASQVKAGGLWAASVGSDSGYCIGVSCITEWPTSQLTTNGTSIYYNTGSFGIGTTSPGSIFSLGGIANFSSTGVSLFSSGGINIKSGCFAVNGVCIGSNSLWTKSGNDIYKNNAGFVGIGVTAPVATLDVAGIARLAPQSSAPATCNASRKGAIAISNSSSRFCVCDGSSWKFDYNGAACTW